MQEILRSLYTCIWFMFLTFPIMVIRVNTIEDTVEWRWMNMLYVGVGSFLLSFLWRYLMRRRELGQKKAEAGEGMEATPFQRFIAEPKVKIPAAVGFGLFILVFPYLFGFYQANIMISAFLYIMLGLGLNIVVGLAGLLDLGYVAFYAVGAYSYALLNMHFDLGFWTVLPLGGILGLFFGVLLGFPVLRLRGDYLAIVTLGFGEIIRLVLENWSEFSHGPSGIPNIPPPSLFGLEMNIQETTYYIYYLMVGLMIFTIFVVTRLKNSRIGRAWMALREDEIACQAMGIDKTKTKLTAFALGATWAGMAGVVFAAKTSFINPASFTFLESAIILSVVVVGGMGSVMGVILGACVLVLLPEHLRAFSEYRMLVFGFSLVMVMVFRPQGIISSERKKYDYLALEETDPAGENG